MKNKFRKKWHPYFANILTAMLEPKGFKVETEVEVGKMPLKIDIVVVRKTENKSVKLPEVFKNFSKYNIIEYKSPDEVLDIGSFDKLLAYALLYKIKNKIKTWQLINAYVYTSGNVKKIEEYIKANKHKLKNVSKGIYYSNFGFNFYLIKLDDVPEKKDYLEILLFGKKRSIKGLIEASLFYGKDTVEEVLKVSSELYPEILKEVLNMPKILEGNKKVIDRALRNFIDSIGKEKIINSIGEEKIINSIGKEKIINSIGEEKIINSIGEEKIINSIGEEKFIAKIGEEKLWKILEERRKKNARQKQTQR